LVHRSAVGFAAVADGEDGDSLAVVVEADAVVADAEAELVQINRSDEVATT
jgi:hypothetical protein